MTPMQKYPHIIGSYAFILKTFVTNIDLWINIFICCGICSTAKLPKQLSLLFNM